MRASFDLRDIAHSHLLRPRLCPTSRNAPLTPPSYSIPSKHDAPAAVAQSLPHDFSLNQTSSVETIKLNRRLLSPRLNPVGNPTSSPRIHPAQPPSVPPVFEDEAADGSGEHASVPLSRRCSRPGCAIGHASSTAGLLPSGRRSSAPQVPRIGSGRRSSQLGMAEPSVPSSSPVDDDDEPNHSAFGSYLLRAARPASPPAPPASTSVAPTPRQPPSILHTSRGGGVSTGGIGVRPVRFLFSRRATSPPDDTATDELDRGRSRDRERPSGAATVRSPSPKARAGASGSRSRSRGVVPDPNRRRSHA